MTHTVEKKSKKHRKPGEVMTSEDEKTYATLVLVYLEGNWSHEADREKLENQCRVSEGGRGKDDPVERETPVFEGRSERTGLKKRTKAVRGKGE